MRISHRVISCVDSGNKIEIDLLKIQKNKMKAFVLSALLGLMASSVPASAVGRMQNCTGKPHTDKVAAAWTCGMCETYNDGRKWQKCRSGGQTWYEPC